MSYDIHSISISRTCPSVQMRNIFMVKFSTASCPFDEFSIWTSIKPFSAFLTECFSFTSSMITILRSVEHFVPLSALYSHSLHRCPHIQTFHMLEIFLFYQAGGTLFHFYAFAQLAKFSLSRILPPLLFLDVLER